jgi:hypothetical protein
MAVATSNQGLGSLFNPDNYTQARPYAGDPFRGLPPKTISGPFGDMEVPITYEGTTYGGSGNTFDSQGNVSGTKPVQPVPVTVVEDPGVSYGDVPIPSIFGPGGYQPSTSVDQNQPLPGIIGGMDQLPIPPLQASLSETYPSVIDPVVRDPVFPSYDTVSIPPMNPFPTPVDPVQAPPTSPFFNPSPPDYMIKGKRMMESPEYQGLLKRYEDSRGQDLSAKSRMEAMLKPYEDLAESYQKIHNKKYTISSSMPEPYEPYSPLQQGIGSFGESYVLDMSQPNPQQVMTSAGQSQPQLVQRDFIDREPVMVQTFRPQPEIQTSCPAPETLIYLTDGNTKQAGELEVGDMVYTQHEDTLAWGEHPVTAVEIVPDQKRLKLTFDHTNFTCSYSHKFYVEGSGWTEVRDMSVGDVVSGHELLSVEETEAGDVVKIQVEDAHTYISEDMLSHNKSLIDPRNRRPTQPIFSGLMRTPDKPEPPAIDPGLFQPRSIVVRD